MNPASNQTIPANSPKPEPQARRRPVPVWLLVLSFLLLYWGMVYFDQRSGWFDPHVYAPYRSFADLQRYQPATGDLSLETGRALFEGPKAGCALCHNTDGSGKPGQAPPLAGSEWASGSPARMIRIPLLGLNGPISVKGQEYNLAMPAMGAGLNDEELASVLSYIRQSWGNKASAVTPEQVKAVRGEVGTRTQPLNAAELNAIP